MILKAHPRPSAGAFDASMNHPQHNRRLEFAPPPEQTRTAARARYSPVAGTATLYRLDPPTNFPGAGRTAAAKTPGSREGVEQYRELAGRLITTALQVTFGVRASQHIASREFSGQVRRHATAFRATHQPASHVRILSLHLQAAGAEPPRAAEEGARPRPGTGQLIESFGSALAGHSRRAFSARLADGRLEVFRVA